MCLRHARLDKRHATTEHSPSPASRAGADLPTNVQAIRYINTHRPRFQVIVIRPNLPTVPTVSQPGRRGGRAQRFPCAPFAFVESRIGLKGGFGSTPGPGKLGKLLTPK